MLSKAEIQTFVLQSSFLAQRKSLSKEEFKAWVIGYAQECSKEVIGETIQFEMDSTRPREFNENFEPTTRERIRSAVLTRKQKLRFETYHKPGFVHLTYNLNKPGIEMLGDIIHELEHERQLRGIGYSKDEQLLCKIAEINYIQPEYSTRHYQNNHLEVLARMAEISAYLSCKELYKKKSISIGDMQAYVDACDKLHRWLQKQLSSNTAKTLITQYSDVVMSCPLEKLDALTPHSHATENDRKILLDFLMDDACVIVDKTYSQCQQAIRDLEITVLEMKQWIEMTRANISHQTFTSYINDFANACDIPCVPSLKTHFPQQRYLPLTKENYHNVIVYASKHLDSPALTNNSKNQPCIVFLDTNNVPTPVNTMHPANRDLQEQDITPHIKNAPSMPLIEDFDVEER
jgi:hypothetical protein